MRTSVSRWHDTDAFSCGKWGSEGPRHRLASLLAHISPSCSLVQRIFCAIWGSRCVTKLFAPWSRRSPMVADAFALVHCQNPRGKQEGRETGMSVRHHTCPQLPGAVIWGNSLSGRALAWSLCVMGRPHGGCQTQFAVLHPSEQKYAYATYRSVSCTQFLFRGVI
jgi:hypothetical protein